MQNYRGSSDRLRLLRIAFPGFALHLTCANLDARQIYLGISDRLRFFLIMQSALYLSSGSIVSLFSFEKIFQQHVGDLGNVEIDEEGTSVFRYQDNLIKVR